MFNVTATVTAACNVATSTDLAFPSYNSLGGNIDQPINILVACSNGTAYTVGLNAGSGPSGFTHRGMVTGTIRPLPFLNYNISEC